MERNRLQLIVNENKNISQQCLQWLYRIAAIYARCNGCGNKVSENPTDYAIV